MAWNMQQATEQMYLRVGVPIRRLFDKTLLTFQNFWQTIVLWHLLKEPTHK